MSTKRDILVDAAHYAVREAVKSGLLPDLAKKTSVCVDCGAIAEMYDHRDYNQALTVEPVCQGCNNRRGPGIPLPSKADGAKTKLSWIDESYGKGWARFDSGDSWTPLESVCHISTTQIESETSDDLSTYSALEPARKRGKREAWRARSDYFKSHDPWRLN